LVVKKFRRNSAQSGVFANFAGGKKGVPNWILGGKNGVPDGSIVH